MDLSLGEGLRIIVSERYPAYQYLSNVAEAACNAAWTSRWCVVDARKCRLGESLGNVGSVAQEIVLAAQELLLW
jgi:hypothetical protein